MTKNSIALRSVSAAAIVGLSLGLGAPVVTAQTTTAPVGSPVIDQTTGNLTIHKLGNPTTTGTPTGNEDPNVTGIPLTGVEFQVTQINLLRADGTTITPGTNEWLEAAQGLTAATLNQWVADKKASLGAVQTVTTAAGLASLTGVNIGAYLVHESKPLTDWDDPSTPETEALDFTPAADFIAFVPMTQENAGTGGTSWNYDVHAYPKNYSKLNPTKKVEDSNQNVGGTLVYDIDTEIRQIEAGKQLKYYYIQDFMDFAHLDVANAQVAVTVDGVTLAAGTDYKIVKQDDTTGEVLINFLDPGLNVLDSGSKVNVKITVKQDVAGPVVPNQAGEIFPHNPTDDLNLTDTPTPGDTPPGDTPPEPTNPVKTYYGDVNFTKVGEGAALAGAEFKIIRTEPGKTCDSIDVKAPGVMGEQNGVVTDTFVSGADGKVIITGLHVTDFEDNAEVAADQRSVYCLVETKSPKDFELLAKPIQFEFTATDTVADDPATPLVDESNRTYSTAKITPTGEVINLKDTTPQLPVTGGAGIGILAAIGAALVGAGAWFARRNSKKA